MPASSSASSPKTPAETLHATTVAIHGRAVLLCGPSGIGKSDLALRLIDRGALLVSDDYTVLTRDGSRLLAAPPPTIAGSMEVRGIGITTMDHVTDIPVVLLLDLADTVERMPEKPLTRAIAGVEIPVMTLAPREPSAPIKVELALHAFGLDIG